MNLSFIKKYSFLIMISALASVMSIIPLVIAAPLLRVARLSYGRIEFWTTQIILSIVLWSVGLEPIAISLISASLLVGLFTEINDQWKNMFLAGLASVIASSIITVTATQQWLNHLGINLKDRVLEQVQLVIQQSHTMNPMIQLDADTLMSQTPSYLVCLMAFSLGLSLILEKSFLRLFRIESYSLDLNLMDFKLPDFMIWIAMFSFLFAFTKFGNKTITVLSLNLVNIMVVFYFFQGLAVIESFFTALKLGIFIRFLTYVVFMIQLLLLVAAIGFIDYWVEFRKKFINKKIA